MLAREQVFMLCCKAGFSPSAYAAANRDLAALRLSDEGLFAHFVNHGAYEGRRCALDLDLDAFAELDRWCRRERFSQIAHAILSIALHQILKSDSLATALAIATKASSPSAIVPVVFGDSHAQVCYKNPFQFGFSRVVPLVVLCSAGSAMGLGNPKSRSGYGDRIRTSLSPIFAQRDAYRRRFLFKFGQVDAEFVSTFQRLRTGSKRFDYDETVAFFERSINAYREYLAGTIPSPLRRNVNVLSIFPPVLSDEAVSSGYFNGHIVAMEGLNVDGIKNELAELEFPNINVRTELHKTYNALLRQAVEKEGFNFVDDFTPMLGANGLADVRFHPSGEPDHHVVNYPSETVFRDIIIDCLTNELL